jgi:hypothetical protein
MTAGPQFRFDLPWDANVPARVLAGLQQALPREARGRSCRRGARRPPTALPARAARQRRSLTAPDRFWLLPDRLQLGTATITTAPHREVGAC